MVLILLKYGENKAKKGEKLYFYKTFKKEFVQDAPYMEIDFFLFGKMGYIFLVSGGKVVKHSDTFALFEKLFTEK